MWNDEPFLRRPVVEQKDVQNSHARNSQQHRKRFWQREGGKNTARREDGRKMCDID